MVLHGFDVLNNAWFSKNKAIASGWCMKHCFLFREVLDDSLYYMFQNLTTPFCSFDESNFNVFQVKAQLKIPTSERNSLLLSPIFLV